MLDDQDMSRSERRAKKELMDRARRALGNEDTRYLMRWVLEQTGMFKPAFTGNSTTFFNEGRREVGLEIVGLLNEIDPYEFVRLMKDGADEIVRKRNEARGQSDEE